MQAVTERSRTTSIHPETRLGMVELTVADLDRQVDFYQRVVGLRLHRRGDGWASLGAGGEDLLRLVERAGARRVRGTTGLYHVAIRLPARRDLARVIARLLGLGHPNYPTDHVMTETTYLDDPEGNGIEIYVDTPEDGRWSFDDGTFAAWDAEGNPRSGRDPLDLDLLLRELRPGDVLAEPLPGATRIGHVHLHVADLAASVRFYHEVLGFDLMGIADRWGMAFVSAGGYHHHIGLNTWVGEGAPPPPEGSLGLRHFTIVAPDAAEVERLRERLTEAGIGIETTDQGLLLRDPSRNGLLVRSAEVARAP